MQDTFPTERSEHPIESIMDSAFGKIRALTDADIIFCNPIVTADGTSIIPISKISVGVVSGGGEYGERRESQPFAGASGAGMSVLPVCFLISDGKSVRMLNVGSQSAFDKIMDTVPEVVGSIFGKKKK